MVDSLRRYSGVIIVILCILGGTVYYLVTGGPGFTMGTDSEKIGIVYGSESEFIWYSDMETVQLIDIPDLGESVSGGNGHNTAYGRFKNDTYGEYSAYIYTKQQQCIQIVHKDGVLLINDSTKKKTNELFKKLTTAIEK